VPDFYQGSELWDLRLVDPDNRQPVDFALRKKLLESLGNDQRACNNDLAQQLLSRSGDSRIKLQVIRQALGYRRSHPELFASGQFLFLGATGVHSLKLFSFARRQGDDWCLVIVPRWQAQGRSDSTSFEMDWQDTRIAMPSGAPSSWSNIFSGATVNTLDENGQNWMELTSVFRDFPIALLAPLSS
jgi:(1->4)-alpha-D-glucan 1-alpha-D-glucosylmutase